MKKKRKKRNPVARLLADRRYQRRVVRSKKLYDRKREARLCQLISRVRPDIN